MDNNTLTGTMPATFSALGLLRCVSFGRHFMTAGFVQLRALVVHWLRQGANDVELLPRRACHGRQHVNQAAVVGVGIQLLERDCDAVVAAVDITNVRQLALSCCGVKTRRASK